MTAREVNEAARSLYEDAVHHEEVEDLGPWTALHADVKDEFRREAKALLIERRGHAEDVADENPDLDRGEVEDVVMRGLEEAGL